MPTEMRILGKNQARTSNDRPARKNVFHKNCLRFRLTLILALILGPVSISLSGAATDPSAPQYLLFQIFLGGPEPRSGIYHRGRSKDDMLRIARHIAATVRLARGDPDRILGFAVGPIAM